MSHAELLVEARRLHGSSNYFAGLTKVIENFQLHSFVQNFCILWLFIEQVIEKEMAMVSCHYQAWWFFAYYKIFWNRIVKYPYNFITKNSTNTVVFRFE